MGNRLSGVANAFYDPKRREFLGRDGARWAKLGIFYFFFYIGLAGFFCAMLAVFMAVTPRDVPTYINRKSVMKTRSNPLSPGLGFRPQPYGEKNLIMINRNEKNYNDSLYVKSLNQYLQVYYWTPDAENPVDKSRFTIRGPNPCSAQNFYGFGQGRPCVLVKMNKIIGFVPEQGYQPEDKELYDQARIQGNSNGIPVYCYGEYPADVDNLGPVTYYSEDGRNDRYGTLRLDRFPYNGKSNRQDVYQAPYVWAQFTNPKKNVLINVMCRIFAKNVYFDRKTSRGLTRFQIFVQDSPNQF